MTWNYRRAELANRPEQYRQFREGHVALEDMLKLVT